MTGSDLAKMFEFSYAAVSRNLDGVSHAESLVVPQPCGGNCLNWVFGHVVTARGHKVRAGCRTLPSGKS